MTVKALHPLTIPTTSHYITFPIKPQDRHVIQWWDQRPQFATYYHTYCYFGYLSEEEMKMTSKAMFSRIHPNKPQVVRDHGESRPANIDIQGRTELWIAEEFVSDSYRGGPLSEFHLQNLGSLTNSRPQSLGGEWITMQLNSCFHYGQDNYRDSQLRRWIVYHPAIAPSLPTPNMFQHRFTDAELGSTMGQIAEAAAEFTPDPYRHGAAAVAGLLSTAIDGVKAIQGHFLHRYLDAKGRQLALNTFEDKFPNIDSNLSKAEKDILLFQHYENEVILTDNKASKSEVEQRGKDVIAFQDKVKKVVKKRGLFAKHLGLGKTKLENPEQESPLSLSDIIGNDLEPEEEDMRGDKLTKIQEVEIEASTKVSGGETKPQSIEPPKTEKILTLKQLLAEKAERDKLAQQKDDTKRQEVTPTKPVPEAYKLYTPDFRMGSHGDSIRERQPSSSSGDALRDIEQTSGHGDIILNNIQGGPSKSGGSPLIEQNLGQKGQHGRYY